MFLIILTIGSLFLAANDSLVNKESSEVYRRPNLLRFLQLPEPPSGYVSVEDRTIISGAPKDTLNTYGTTQNSGGVYGNSFNTGGNYNAQGGVVSGGVTGTGGTNLDEVIPPLGVAKSQLSPLYGKVKITSFSPAYSESSLGSFRLTLPSWSREVVSVSGWKLKGNTGFTAEVPKGVGDYNSAGFAQDEDIVLKPGDTLYIYTTRPSFIKNIRLNKCVGYLNNHFRVSPTFPSLCPSVMSKEDYVTFSGKCQAFLSSLRNCAEPNEASFGQPGVTPQCVAFAQERLGYGQCYKNHRQDSDFFSDTWHAWITTPLSFDITHDRILLTDKDGKVVDAYIY